MCVSRSFSQYGVLGICTFDTFFIMAIFRGQGFLFYFLLAAPHPFIAHSIRCGATLMLLPAGGIPARFPACLLLPIAAGTDA